VAAEALEQSVLESKDKDQLLAIAKALGLKANSRTKKAEIIDSILEMTGSAAPGTAAPNGDLPPVVEEQPASEGLNGSAVSIGGGTGLSPSRPLPAPQAPFLVDSAVEPIGAGPPVLGEDGEPLAEWELALGSTTDEGPVAASSEGGAPASPPVDVSSGIEAGLATSGEPQTAVTADGESRNRRRRRRRKGNRGPEGPQGDDAGLVEADLESQPVANEPVEVSGYIDMRDEGYGFLRVKGYLPSREDSYIPVKLARQYGLRKGDQITGTSRPAGRNEKNPALLDVLTINGADPELARKRQRFEDLTALFPDENLHLEDPSDPGNMTARIIDLVSPIGKGQRGIIVSPPKAGKTTIMKTIVHSIEQNNPEVRVIVLLIDERPEEVTDMRRHVQRGEVIASTFDRPSDEHTHVAELAIEKAKRLVEQGHDVVVMLDGITRLSRAYNLAAPASGRILSGGIDAGALYPPKKFFGAARNVEEGGSLTILATALVETNSRMDEAIFEEFKGTGNMELRLDRRLAERRIYPAIDVDASSTRHEELLFDRKQLQMVWKLRRVLSGLAADGNAAPGLELLIDRLKTFRTNAEFLNEIAKQPSM
jgi:transcription termination factor Rho